MGKGKNKNKREELYIINSDSGQTLFFHSFTPLDHDAELFAGLLTAIMQFARCYSQYNIGGFSMKKNRIAILRSPEYPLAYVYIMNHASKKEKENLKQEKKILKKLELISKEFEKKFNSKQILKWNGDVMIFKGFIENINGIVRPWDKLRQFGI